MLRPIGRVELGNCQEIRISIDNALIIVVNIRFFRFIDHAVASNQKPVHRAMILKCFKQVGKNMVIFHV